MEAYPEYIDIRKIGINRTGLTTDEKCRYSLTIDFENENKPILVVIMMNPSHANEVSSDKTVNIVIDYAHNYFDKLFVFNVLPIVAPSNDKFANIENLDFHCKKNIETLITELGYLIEKEKEIKIKVILATGSPKDTKIKEVFDRELQSVYKILYNNLESINIESVSYKGSKLKNKKYTYHPSRKENDTFLPDVNLTIIKDPTGKYLLKI